MRLVLIRHGATEWNLNKRIQGHTDIPLSDRGRKALLGLSLPTDLDITRWYSSPLIRAVDSAQLLDIKAPRIEPALIEMNWGDWEGEILKPLRRRLGDEMRHNEARGLDFRPPGGESPREVQQRLQPWLNKIAEDGIDVGAVVHKGIIRCIYAMATGWDMRGESPVDFAWDALHLFQLDAAGNPDGSYRSIPLDGRA